MTNSDCINLEGSYKCNCLSGFECKQKNKNWIKSTYLFHMSSYFSWFFSMPDKSEHSRFLTGINCFTKLPKRLFQQPIMFMDDHGISWHESSFENIWFRGIVFTEHQNVKEWFSKSIISDRKYIWLSWNKGRWNHIYGFKQI